MESHKWIPGDVITSTRLNSLECRALDSVTAMTHAGLSAGDVAATRGYTSAGDGGAAAYDIRLRQPGDVLDDWSLIAVGDTLTAVLRLPPVLDCRSCGIMPNASVDSSTRINQVLARLQGIWPLQSRPILYLPAGVYRCDNPITCKGSVMIRGDYPPTGWGMGRNTSGTCLDFTKATFASTTCVDGPDVEQIWINCGAFKVVEDRTKLDPTALSGGDWWKATTVREKVNGLRVIMNANRVAVTGASGTGIDVGAAADCADCAVYECNLGFNVLNDNLLYGLYGFTVETFIRFGGAISTLIGARCDSCHGDALVFEYVAKTTATGVNLDWVGGSAVRFGPGARGNTVTNLTCSRVATHGSSLADQTQPTGHGMIRLKGDAAGNYASLLTGRDGTLDKPVEGVPSYLSPGTPVVCDTCTGAANMVEIRGGAFGYLDSEVSPNTVTKTAGSTNTGRLIIDNGAVRHTIDLATI